MITYLRINVLFHKASGSLDVNLKPICCDVIKIRLLRMQILQQNIYSKKIKEYRNNNACFLIVMLSHQP